MKPERISFRILKALFLDKMSERSLGRCLNATPVAVGSSLRPLWTNGYIHVALMSREGRHGPLARKYELTPRGLEKVKGLLS
jgi:hypothetical protein